MTRNIKKRFNLIINSAGETKKDTFTLDKDITQIKGLVFTADKDDLLYYRGNAKVEINSVEYFPEDYETKLLMSGVNVPIDQRYCTLNARPGNGQVYVVYTDVADGRTTFTPYRVSLYLDCLKEDAV